MNNEQLLQRIEALERTINAMRAGATIPFDIGEAFKDRLGSSATFGAIDSFQYGKSVNEAGSDTYTVARLMDRTVPINLNGTIYYIGLYN